MANKIQIKRGLKANLPLLDVGEPAFTTDTKEFFIGDGISNIDFAKQSDLEITNSQVQDLSFKLAGGTANVITLSMQPLTDGYSKTFIASANNAGAATKINGKPLYKPNTTVAPNLISGKAYTIWYNKAGDCFFIKASAEGDAVAANVLAGKKFSNDNDTGLVGTLDLGNLVSGNIKSGVNINGVQGKSSVVDTADANASAGQILNGVSAYINGNKVIGNIPAIPGGTPPNNVAYWAPNTNGNTYAKVHFLPPRGYYDGTSWLSQDMPDLLAQNIVAGKNIFGVAGSANQSIHASGSLKVAKSAQSSVVNIGWKPNVIVISYGFSWSSGSTYSSSQGTIIIEQTSLGLYNVFGGSNYLSSSDGRDHNYPAYGSTNNSTVPITSELISYDGYGNITFKSNSNADVTYNYRCYS
ncbi:hypothetical protein [Clostridium sp. YIM B02555]|uniref:hyaluronate lyase N-terminal domain-containing protein n=1 Tax=Clostridium sp. YIM B02555 TaxID=2911968 RepID=UPI001EED7A6C|nr:hypothetical protein [Clostridium sp. YIM B02555]